MKRRGLFGLLLAPFILPLIKVQEKARDCVWLISLDGTYVYSTLSDAIKDAKPERNDLIVLLPSKYPTIIPYMPNTILTTETNKITIAFKEG
jgi:hypothetical protein